MRRSSSSNMVQKNPVTEANINVASAAAYVLVTKASPCFLMNRPYNRLATKSILDKSRLILRGGQS